jgi:hypothetical protein
MKKLSMSDFGIFMLAFKILLICLTPQLSGKCLSKITVILSSFSQKNIFPSRWLGCDVSGLGQ